MTFDRDSDERAEQPLEIAAMVDIVFILLAFFVMATRFRMPERDVDMGYDPAAASAGVRAEDLPEVIPVRLRWTGGPVAITVGQNSLPAGEYDAIRRLLAEINLPQVPVRISADPRLTVGEVARATDAVLASPMNNVSLSSQAGRQDPPPGALP